VHREQSVLEAARVTRKLAAHNGAIILMVALVCLRTANAVLQVFDDGVHRHSLLLVLQVDAIRFIDLDELVHFLHRFDAAQLLTFACPIRSGWSIT
jgi:hypothetical protein